MDEWKRFANAAVQEELIAQAGGAAEEIRPRESPTTWRRPLASCTRSRNAGSRPRKRRARRRRRCGTAIARRRIRSRPRRASSSRRAPKSGRATWKKKLALCERAEALADSTDWIKTADEMKKLQAEWQAIGPVPRPDTRVVWKRFREACDEFFTRRNEDLAQRKEVWATNQAKKEALCARAEELAESREWDTRGRGDPSAAGGLEDDRSGAPEQVRSAVAALPRRMRSLLRSLQAPRRDRDRSRARRIAKRLRSSSSHSCPPRRPSRNRPPICSSASDRCARAGTSPRRQSSQGADPLSGRFMGAMERVLTAYPDGVQGQRARRRSQPAADGEAGARASRASCPTTRPTPVVVAGARGAAARSARRQHHRRPRRRRIQVARDGRRSASGAGVVLAAGAGSGRSRPGSSRTASTRRATGSSSSTGATCRRSSAQARSGRAVQTTR